MICRQCTAQDHGNCKDLPRLQAVQAGNLPGAPALHASAWCDCQHAEGDYGRQ